MKAAHVAEYYTAYLEGSLPEELRQEVARHLQACPQCAAELEEMRLLVADLRELPQVPAPANFAAGVRARLDARPAPRPWFLRMPALAGGTLAAAALVLAIVFAPNLHAPRETLVAQQPEGAEHKAWKDLPSTDMELKAQDLQTVPPATAAAPAPAELESDPFVVGNTRAKAAPMAPLAAPAERPEADARGGIAFKSMGRPNRDDGPIRLDSKDKSMTPPRTEAADGQPTPAAATPASAAKPDSIVGEPAPTLVAKLPPVAAEMNTEAAPPAAGLPMTKAADPNGQLGPAGPQGPAGPAGPAGASTPPGTTPPGEATVSAVTARAKLPSAQTFGRTTAADQSDQEKTEGDLSVTGGVTRGYLDSDGDTRFRYALSGALVLRSAVVKGTEATITVETAAKTPAGLALRPVEPTPGKARTYPLSGEARTAAFTLPLNRGGSVVELTVNAGEATTRAYLAVPDTSARKVLLTLNLAKAPMTVALRELAVAGHIFILCPPEFAEMKDVTYATRRTQPAPALSELATQQGYRAVFTDNVAILVPKPPAP